MRWIFTLLLAPAVYATSVAPELHECPVCGVKSVTYMLASYSQFGEPARDLSDAPSFAFAKVDVCPGDLFASWAGAWEAVRPEEKEKLEAFLKDPGLRLTDGEKAIITGHEADFRQSAWFLPLWARTCDAFRDLDARARFDRHLWLHFTGRFAARSDDAPDWGKRLTSVYRENAISALKDAATADWPKPADKRVFAYLRAELTRQAGRKAEALILFNEVIASEKTAEPDDELEWISRWAKEQSLLCDPDKEDTASPEPRDDEPAREVSEKTWRRDVLLPSVSKAVAEGGLPAIKMPSDESPFANLPPLPGEADETPKRNLKKLDRELYDLWQEQEPDARADIARIYIRLLRDSEETWESTQYPAMYFLPGIAETEDGRAAIVREMGGDWKSSFWKAACAYAARMPDSGDTFVRHPFSGEADTSLVVKLLMQRTDSSWVPQAIGKLNRHAWVSDDLTTYLASLGLPEADAALEQAAADIRREMGDQVGGKLDDGKLSTLQMLDGLRVRKGLAELPIR